MKFFYFFLLICFFFLMDIPYANSIDLVNDYTTNSMVWNGTNTGSFIADETQLYANVTRDSEMNNETVIAERDFSFTAAETQVHVSFDWSLDITAEWNSANPVNEDNDHLMAQGTIQFLNYDPWTPYLDNWNLVNLDYMWYNLPQTPPFTLDFTGEGYSGHFEQDIDLEIGQNYSWHLIAQVTGGGAYIDYMVDATAQINNIVIDYPGMLSGGIEGTGSVPEPSTVWLVLGSCLAGMIVIWRKF